MCVCLSFSRRRHSSWGFPSILLGLDPGNSQLLSKLPSKNLGTLGHKPFLFIHVPSNTITWDTIPNTWKSIIYLSLYLLLLLLSRFSRVQLCVTPKMAAHQAPLSLGFSRQEHWEWVASSFSHAWKWKVKVKSLSHVRLLATPWDAACQAPTSIGFSRQEYWSGVTLPSPITVFECHIIHILYKILTF